MSLYANRVFTSVPYIDPYLLYAIVMIFYKGNSNSIESGDISDYSFSSEDWI